MELRGQLVVDEELYMHMQRSIPSEFVQEPSMHHSVEDKDMLVKPGLYGCKMNTELPRNVGVKTVLAFDVSVFSAKVPGSKR